MQLDLQNWKAALPTRCRLVEGEIALVRQHVLITGAMD